MVVVAEHLSSERSGSCGFLPYLKSPHINQFPLYDVNICIIHIFGPYLTIVVLLGWWRSKLGPPHQPIHGPLCSSAGQTAGIVHHSHSWAAVLFVRLCRPDAGMLGGFPRGGEGSKRRSRYSGGRRGHGRLRHFSGFWHLQYVLVFMTHYEKLITFNNTKSMWL